MEPTENLAALATLLKTLHRGVEQLRSEYRAAHGDIDAHIRDLRLRSHRGSTKTLRNLQKIQLERHHQLADLVPSARTLRIRVAQAKAGLIYGSLESAAAPLLVSLMEMAVSDNPFPDFHHMWGVSLHPHLLMGAEIDVIGGINGRGCGKLWELLHKDRHFVLELRGGTLRELRSELLGLMETDGQSAASTAPHTYPNPRRVAFETLRRQLKDTLSPEEFGLLKEFGRFF